MHPAVLSRSEHNLPDWAKRRFLVQPCLQRAANMIPAHDSPLAALAFDASGTKLATASEKVKVPMCLLISGEEQ